MARSLQGPKSSSKQTGLLLHDAVCPPYTLLSPEWCISGGGARNVPVVRRWSRSFAWNRAGQWDCPLGSAGGWLLPLTAGSPPSGQSYRCPCHGRHLLNLEVGKERRHLFRGISERRKGCLTCWSHHVWSHRHKTCVFDGQTRQYADWRIGACLYVCFKL